MQREMAFSQVQQLVLNQMAEDPARNHGLRTVQQKIARTEGIHLPRYVNSARS